MRVTTKAAGFFAATVADLVRSAEFARMDWLHDVTGAAKLFARAGRTHASDLSKAVYNAHGVDVTGPKAQAAYRKLAKRFSNPRSKMAPKLLKDLQEYQAVSQAIRAAKAKAFGSAKRKVSKAKAVRVSRKAQGLVKKLEALGYRVRLSAAK